MPDATVDVHVHHDGMLQRYSDKHVGGEETSSSWLAFFPLCPDRTGEHCSPYVLYPWRAQNLKINSATLSFLIPNSLTEKNSTRRTAKLRAHTGPKDPATRLGTGDGNLVDAATGESLLAPSTRFDAFLKKLVLGGLTSRD